MMETTEIINEDLIRKTVTTDIDLKVLRKELKYIEKEIKDLEKQPDEIMMPNETKFYTLAHAKIRKEEITSLLDL